MMSPLRRRIAIGVVSGLVAAIVIIFAVGLALTLSWQSTELTRTHDLGLQTRALAVEANSLATEIKQSRTASIREACRAQNRRHAHTVRTLKHIFTQATRGLPRAARPQLKRSHQATLLLVDALAPIEDCAARVRTLSHP